MRTTFIYTLTDPRTGFVRYVGKTDKPESRAKSHLRREKTVKAKWVRSLLKIGLRPVFEILEEVPHEEWCFWEQYWIRVMRGWGFKLLNGDNGGKDHFKMSPEIIRKISLKLTGRKNQNCWKRVSAYNLDGEFVATFQSLTLAEKETGAKTGNIVKAIKKHRPARHLLWSYEERPRIQSPYIAERALQGICWHPRARKWQARINKKYLGLFVTQLEAAKAIQGARTCA